MHRTFASLLVSVTAVFAGCSEESSGEGDGGGAMGGAATGGSAGASPGTGGSATGGDTSGGGTSSGTSGASGTSTGGSATGGSATGGSATGGFAGRSGNMGGAGMSGDAGADGAGTGAGGAGAGGGGRGGAGGAAGGAGGGGGAHAMMNFFVTSDTSMTGNLGGLAMADMRCQTLAAAVGHGSKMWRAYLSVANPMTHAINRIGEGPYYNSAGAVVAMTKAALHERSGDAALFIDERGNRVNGQWQGSPTPNQHDVLTGSARSGMLQMNATCSDWTSTSGNAQVGHSDGLGPGMATTGNYPYWNGSHTAPCGDLASTGGAGKLYCFVAPP